jgi:predicted outer membrane repeat protein
MATLLAATMLVVPASAPAQASGTQNCEVTSSADSGAGTLRNCVGLLGIGDQSVAITFASNVTSIALNSPIEHISNSTNNDLSVSISGSASNPVSIFPSGSFSNPNNLHLLRFEIGTSLAITLHRVLIFDTTAGAVGVALNGGVASNSSLTVSNALFLDNSRVAGPVGAGIYSQVPLTVSNSLFEGNSATSGGAIYATAAVSIDTVSFTENSAEADGGAIYSTGAGLLTVDNSFFTANTAVHDGGAIYVPSSGLNLQVDVSGSSFFGNIAEDGEGGAIHADEDIEITSSEFEGSRANEDGGAVHSFQGMVTVDSSRFDDNRSLDEDGGAIWASEDITITDSTFTSNYAEDVGGALASSSGDVIVSGSTFDLNHADSGGATGTGDEAGGGAIYARDLVLVSNSIFDGNSSRLDGGALYAQMEDGEESLITSSTFRNNFVIGEDISDFRIGDGGAIYSDEDVRIENSHFLSNSAYDDGGAVYSGEDARAYSSSFVSNTAGGTGGAIDVDEDGIFHDSHFESNQSGQSGGALLVSEVLVIVRSSFVNNRSDGAGGAVRGPTEMYDRSLIAYSTFSGNQAQEGGGAIRSASVARLAFNTFADNSAVGPGKDFEMTNSNSVFAIGNIFGSSASSGDPRVVLAGDFNDLGGNLSTGTETVFTAASSKAGLTFNALNLSGNLEQTNGTFARVPFTGSAAEGAVSEEEYDAYIAAFFTNGPFNESRLYLDQEDSESQFIVDQARVAPTAPFTAGSISTVSAGVIYTGPVVTNDPETAQSGSTVTYTGSDLDEVTSATIAGQSAAIVSKSAGSLTLRVPAGLSQGIHDVILHYSTTESLTLQNGLVVQDLMKVWTQLQSDNTVKMYAKNIVGVGKIQFFHNNNEIAWVKATNALNPKLRQANGSSYLVRTRELVEGKNAFEIHQDGKRIWRAAYAG